MGDRHFPAAAGRQDVPTSRRDGTPGSCGRDTGTATVVRVTDDTNPGEASAMTTSTTVPTQPTTSPVEQSEARRALSGLWPLAAAGAGVHVRRLHHVHVALHDRRRDRAAASPGVRRGRRRRTRTHLGVVAAFLCVGFLAVFAAGFGRFLAARAPQGSLAAAVARIGLCGLGRDRRPGRRRSRRSTAAACPTTATPGCTRRRPSSRFQILVDQYQWAAYWTLALAMGAVACSA